MMLGRLLNAGFVSQARELAALFEHDSPDLTIVLVGIEGGGGGGGWHSPHHCVGRYRGGGAFTSPLCW